VKGKEVTAGRGELQQKEGRRTIYSRPRYEQSFLLFNRKRETSNSDKKRGEPPKGGKEESSRPKREKKRRGEKENVAPLPSLLG